MPTQDGGIANTFNQISQLGISHFKHIYKEPPATNLTDIIQLVGHFPSFVDLEFANELTIPVTADELEGTLKWFIKDKCLGPDGWNIKFYIAFYDIIKNDLLNAVEECRILGNMYEAINSILICLIPKFDSPSSFNDFQPISLCNTLYKIVIKIIVNWLHPILSHHIYP